MSRLVSVIATLARNYLATGLANAFGGERSAGVMQQGGRS